MIKGFYIGNFKAISKTQYMPFAKINLIFGPNSCGKSSLVKGLLYSQELLKTKIENEDICFELAQDMENNIWGTPHDISFKHNTDYKIGFKIDKRTFLNNFEIVNSTKLKSNIYDIIDDIVVMLNFQWDTEEIDQYEKVGDDATFVGKVDHYITIFNYSFIINKKVLFTIQYLGTAPFHFECDKDEMIKYIMLLFNIKEKQIEEEINNEHEFEVKKSLLYDINIPSHYINKIVKSAAMVVKKCFIQKTILYCPGNREAFKDNKVNYKILDEINEWFRDNKIYHKIDILDDDIKITDTKNNIFVRKEDIGVGIGHLIPILQYAFGSRNDIIIIEEPELHLHPLLQCDIADVIIKSAINYKNQLIIETHSEHIILRILRRIREKRINISDVSVVYIDNSEDGLKILHLPITEKGNFTVPWPNNFFESRWNEIR